MTLEILYSPLGRTNNEVLSLSLSSNTTPLRKSISEELLANVLTLQAKGTNIPARTLSDSNLSRQPGMKTWEFYGLSVLVIKDCLTCFRGSLNNEQQWALFKKQLLMESTSTTFLCTFSTTGTFYLISFSYNPWQFHSPQNSCLLDTRTRSPFYTVHIL